MKVKFHMWCLALLFALSTFAIPVAAQAHWCGGGCGGYGGGGIIYNSNDCKWYHVPNDGRNVIYKGVDDKYVPVAKYGCYCHRMGYYKHHHKYHKYACTKRFVSVVCQTRPTHWFAGVWYPESRECFYKLR